MWLDSGRLLARRVAFKVRFFGLGAAGGRGTGNRDHEIGNRGQRSGVRDQGGRPVGVGAAAVSESRTGARGRRPRQLPWGPCHGRWPPDEASGAADVVLK